MDNISNFDLENPKHVERILDMCFGLPSDDEVSEEEADFGAREELQALEETSKSQTPNELIQNFVLEEEFDNKLIFDNDESEESEEDDDEEWTEDLSYFEQENPIFDFEASTSKNFENAKSELDYFLNLMDNDLLNLIVVETNRYAQEKPGSSSNNWINITLEELKAFIGCHILMGIHILPRLHCYWSSDPSLSVPNINKVMTAKRFKKITEMLHCNDNSMNTNKSDVNHDKLFKIRPLLIKINNNCQESYNHSNYLSIDESMIPFKGRSSLKQYMPQKPVKRGYKVWCLSDSETGYVIKFDVYTGKKKEGSESKQFGLGESVILNLTKNLQRKPVLVAFDNFFTTFKIVKLLKRKNIYSCGTVRGNRKGLPEILKPKSKLHMKKGEHKFATRNVVAAVKWMDSREVSVLSSLYSPKDISIVQRKNKNGKKEDIPCPKVNKYFLK